MSTPVNAASKTINAVFLLIAEGFNSFTETLGWQSYGLVCLLLILIFKYGFKHFTTFLNTVSTNKKSIKRDFSIKKPKSQPVARR